MIETIIKFNTTNDISRFVAMTNKYSHNIYLHSGRYIVDGKSIMGIYSLDWSKPIKIEVDEPFDRGFINDLAPYIWEGRTI